MKWILPLLFLSLFLAQPTFAQQPVVIRGQPTVYTRELAPEEIAEVSVHMEGNAIVLISLAQPDPSTSLQHFYKTVTSSQRDSAMDNAFLLAEKLNAAGKIRMRFSREAQVNRSTLEIDRKIYHPLYTLTVTVPRKPASNP